MRESVQEAAPSLRALLADNYPARAIARNLFRLSRLLEVQAKEDLRSEGDFLKQWWRTADGKPDGRRDPFAANLSYRAALSIRTTGGVSRRLRPIRNRTSSTLPTLRRRVPTNCLPNREEWGAAS